MDMEDGGHGEVWKVDILCFMEEWSEESDKEEGKHFNEYRKEGLWCVTDHFVFHFHQTCKAGWLGN